MALAEGAASPGEAVTVSHPGAAKDNVHCGGQCACLGCQDQAPALPGTCPHSGTLAPGCPGPANYAAMVGEAHTLKRTQSPGCQRPGPSTGQQEMGYHPKVTFSVGLSSWQPLPCHLCRTGHHGGWALCLRQPLCTPPLSVLFWQNLGALCGQQKPLMSRLAAVRIKCSEGLGAQGRRKCVVLVCSKGTIACS